MSRPVLEVRGARELRASLRRAGRDTTELKAVHAQVGRIVVAAATAPRRTGRLQASVRAGTAASSATVRAGGARVPYAGPIHWGWPARGIAARPFLTDAAQRTEPTWTEVYEREIDRILDEIQGA